MPPASFRTRPPSPESRLYAELPPALGAASYWGWPIFLPSRGLALTAYAGSLWLPVPQMNRTAGFQKGTETVHFPVQLPKLPIGAKPFRD